MLITLHGKLAEDFGAEHRIEAASVKEAVEGLTRQIGFYDHLMVEERPVVRIVGYDTESSLEQSAESIDIVPAIAGGKGVGKVLLGAALIGIAILNPGIGGMILSQAGVSLFAGLGVSLMLSGLAQLFAKAPSLSGQEDPEASKYLGLSNNTTRLGTLRSYSMGRIKLTAPHLLALNVDSTDLVKGEFPT